MIDVSGASCHGCIVLDLVVTAAQGVKFIYRRIREQVRAVCRSSAAASGASSSAALSWAAMHPGQM